MIYNIVKKLSKDAIIYGLSHIVGRGIDFLTIPILTRLFVPADYGVIDLILSTFIFLGILMSCGTHSAFYYYFYKKPYDGNFKKRRALFTAVLLWNILGGLIISAAVIAGLYLWRAPGFIADASFVALLSLCGFGIFKTLEQRLQELFRIEQKPWFFFVIRLVGGTCIFVSVCALYLYDTPTISHYIYVSLLAYVCICAIGVYYARRYIGFLNIGAIKESIQKCGMLLRFGFPLVPGTLAMCLLYVSDRWVLSYFGFDEELGFYALAVKISQIVALGVSVFTLAFQPYSMQAIHEADQKKQGEIFDVFLRYFLGIYLAVSFVISTLSPIIIDVIAPSAYAPAYIAVANLCFAAVLFGVTYFTSLGSWKVEKTIYFSAAMVIAGITNLVLNIYFIPLYGMLAAAVTTSASMLLLVIVSFFFSQKLYAYPFQLLRLGLLIGVGIVGTALLTHFAIASTPAMVVMLAIVGMIAALTLICVSPSDISRMKALFLLDDNQ